MNHNSDLGDIHVYTNGFLLCVIRVELQETLVKEGFRISIFHFPIANISVYTFFKT